MTKLDLDVAVVGAGFAGLFALYRLRKLGFKVRAFDAASGVGGTWYWNRYPGARCDVESLEYSYQFSAELQQEWEWTERYASQTELLRYLNHVADRFNLRTDIQLNTRISAAHFDEDNHLWLLHTDAQDDIRARWLVMATGCLSSPNKPRLQGLEQFRGEMYHTGTWPHESPNFSGKCVGIIGTGSSGIQCLPPIAQQADRVVVFQRSAAYTVPAHNRSLDPDLQRRVKAEYPAFRALCSSQFAAINTNSSKVSALEVGPEERRRIFDERWAHGGLPFTGAFADLRRTLAANETAADYVRGKITELVKDPAVAKKLLPITPFACKRLCVDTNYYSTFNRPNLTLVDLKAEPIRAMTSNECVTAQSRFSLDVLVFATGFDAMTGALLAMDIRGRKGLRLSRAWHAGSRTYLGLATAGFPNLFMITGPGSPSVLSNMAVAIEQHVNWVAECIQAMEARGVKELDANPQAQDAWVEHVNEVANVTLFPKADSWYMGANIPGKPQVFMPYVGGFPNYVIRCNEVAANNFEGFQLT